MTFRSSLVLDLIGPGRKVDRMHVNRSLVLIELPKIGAGEEGRRSCGWEGRSSGTTEN
jgi:hypothetical protein